METFKKYLEYILDFFLSFLEGVLEVLSNIDFD